MYIGHDARTDKRHYFATPLCDSGMRWTGEVFLYDPVDNFYGASTDPLDRVLIDRGDQEVENNRIVGKYIRPWWSATIEIDHERQVVNLDLEAQHQHKNRRPSTTSDRYSYTIPGPKADDSLLNPKLTSGMLAAVVKVDPTVAGFSLVGTPYYEGKTVQDVVGGAAHADPVNRAVRDETLTFYHGTSLKRWRDQISQEGLIPGKGKEYSDKVEGYSDHNVYLSVTIEEARNYASRAAVWDRSSGAVVKVTVRDPARLVADEDSMHWARQHKHMRKTLSGDENDFHLKHLTPSSPKFKQFVNTSWATSLRQGTVGYRGRILPRDLKLAETFKPVRMVRDPDDDEFETAMAKTADTLKRHESQARRLIEAVLSGEFWIFEDGDVHYCDGDVGDTNHEGYAIEAAQHKLLDACGLEADEQVMDADRLGEILRDGLIEDTEPGDEDRVRELDTYDVAEEMGKRYHVEQDLVDVAMQRSHSDPRKYACQHWGWSMLRNDHVETWDLTEKSLKAIARGIMAALDQEGVEEVDPEAEFRVADYRGRRSVVLTYAQLEAGDFGEVVPPPAAPPEQVRKLDQDAAPGFYGGSLGDSAARIVATLTG